MSAQYLERKRKVCRSALSSLQNEVSLCEGNGALRRHSVAFYTERLEIPNYCFGGRCMKRKDESYSFVQQNCAAHALAHQKKTHTLLKPLLTSALQPSIDLVNLLALLLLIHDNPQVLIVHQALVVPLKDVLNTLLFCRLLQTYV